MGETRREMRVFEVRATCDLCGGEMRPTGAALMSNPPQFPHECVKCKSTRNFGSKYPCIRHESAAPVVAEANLKPCGCTMSQRVLGDGCEKCNPKGAVEIYKTTITDLQAEVNLLSRLPQFLKSYNPNLPMGPGMHAQFLLLMDELREYWDGE